ncbi:SNF2 family DNA or RNA helicase [Pseudomonas duriflava]|uniref:SNF2 family DNA or RNA helicase n=1 Tax=Pseudomonas duriflava TaxID=459528 RepID=A0A562QP03_9PSED|nr:DEAD/DEAH box helicase [Pseudomonas duriflava]TWI58425.1 SNF2 family DNA or RNA helicase [Pseudomonas duriflava]
MRLRFDHLHWQDWKGSFTERNLERGRRYALEGLATVRSAADGLIYAQCSSPSGLVYRQSLTLKAGQKSWQVDSRCTCGAGRNCKHSAAVLFELERRQRAGDPPPRREASEGTVQQIKPPVPVLTLGSHVQVDYDRQTARMRPITRHRAALAFVYGSQRVFGKPLPGRTSFGQKPAQPLIRHGEAEQHFRRTLQEAGLRVATRRSAALAEEAGEMLEMPDDSSWLHFVQDVVPRLRHQGWQIDIRPEFIFELSEVEGWYGEIEEAIDHQWFDLEVGILVEGRRISLLPILIELIRRDPHLFEPDALARRSDEERLLLRLENPKVRKQGRATRVALPLGRLKPILNTLVELYGQALPSDTKQLRLSPLDASRLAELDDALPLTWQGGEQLRHFAQRLRHYAATPVTVPAELHAELRPYQRDGLAWMQALRELEVGGILADDMGLGKTLQTLAHILIEKQAGRLSAPALIVMPTSLIPNWQDEAARFTPTLKVLALQGTQRRALFEQITEHDIVLTTYALLPRDAEQLAAFAFHLLVLDEAQSIKNAATKAAQAARNIQTRHRLCLTGTPLENHLGELWSQFHFLMPGWLGDAKRFKHDYQTPIEKQGDQQRLSHLKARIKPFILRRTKQRVARELPPKTEIIQLVDLTPSQRDLYETVRLALDEKVRTEIAHKGLARSQLIVLDALLRLRQICCDIRLVQADIQTPKPSGKLAGLMDLLDGLLANGSRVLLFSQFTSMLALIQQELDTRSVPYVTLTGETQDRRAPVERFQSGEVPVFLLSLKAGGTGLNLTAADTVIHFDPWWNPAAENQATDRAYRIGQDKPVFVYKLIARGTLEEKIQQLQNEKARLAAGILDEHGGDWRMTEADIEALFAPLGK